MTLVQKPPITGRVGRRQPHGAATDMASTLMEKGKRGVLIRGIKSPRWLELSHFQHLQEPCCMA